ncbi:MAG: pentapeptide repeat-containing protein [Gemmiger sp.]|nr:pentapeptide repeat-containing protein [Gemmiger sp.]
MATTKCYQGEVFTALEPGTLWENCEYNDCTFRNCRWLGVRVQNCSFLGCCFIGCALSGVTFSFCRMRDAWLENCTFRSIAWGGLRGRSALAQPFGKAVGCAFQYNDFSGMVLSGFDFSSNRFAECTFDDCKLPGANFRGVPLGRSQFAGCDLTKADFRDAESYAIDPTANTLKGARFSFPEVVTLLDGTGIQIE